MAEDPAVGETGATMAGDDDGLAAGATSGQAQAGDVTGGGTATGISDAADGRRPRAEDAAPIAEDDQHDRGHLNTAGQGEGTGGADGTTGDAADGAAWPDRPSQDANGDGMNVGLSAEPADGAEANAASGAAVTADAVDEARRA